MTDCGDVYLPAYLDWSRWEYDEEDELVEVPGGFPVFEWVRVVGIAGTAPKWVKYNPDDWRRMSYDNTGWFPVEPGCRLYYSDTCVVRIIYSAGYSAPIDGGVFSLERRKPSFRTPKDMSYVLSAILTGELPEDYLTK